MDKTFIINLLAILSDTNLDIIKQFKNILPSFTQDNLYRIHKILSTEVFKSDDLTSPDLPKEKLIELISELFPKYVEIVNDSW